MTDCLDHILFLRRIRRIVATGPVLACCFLGAFLLSGHPAWFRALLGLPFLGAFLGSLVVLSGLAEPAVPGKAQHLVVLDVAGRVAWGGMAALGAWLFLPPSPSFLPVTLWLALETGMVLLALHIVMKRIVRLRVDQVAALMWKGALPATVFWLLMVAALA